jgi:hypothetical protein
MNHYHYCRLESLCKIVKSSSLRMSNVQYMNDYLELEWFYSMCRSVADELRSRSIDSAPAEAEARAVFYEQLQGWLSNRFDHIYCACFSKERDDLSQWRGYADDAKGVCMAIDLDKIVEANPTCWSLRRVSVEYAEAEQKKRAKEVVLEAERKLQSGTDDGLGRAAFTSTTIRHLAPIFKNPGFAAEREVRLVVSPSSDHTGDRSRRY